MAKVRTVFICRSCGGVQPRWMGRCPDCGAWDALEEQRDLPVERGSQAAIVDAWADLGGDTPPSAERALPITQVRSDSPIPTRLSTGLGELDRVLGGGIVPGSALLLGGEPGIGKSTLLMQAASGLARAGARTLYLSSEESSQQIRMRAERLGAAENPELFVLAETNLDRAVEQMRTVEPRVIVVDSIQMMYTPKASGAPGSVSQVRRCAADLTMLAKAAGFAIVLVGHVTKDGQLAGPRLLEHLVDAVVNFEGDRTHAHRLIRAIKNRFGTTLEIGLVEMTDEGLLPRETLALTGPIGTSDPRPGSVLCPIVHGTRCVLAEIQALTATGFLGAAKRKSSGLDANRLAMLIAVLEQHAELRLADRDIFASAVGGIRVTEPASDLALLLAIAGAHHRRTLDRATVAMGEVGLGGEVRAITHAEQRLREAARLGATRCILPEASKVPAIAKLARTLKLELDAVTTIEQAIERLG